MRHAAKSAIWAAGLYVMGLAFAALPARAELFEFDFSTRDAQGTLTTGAATPDPGYDLVINLTFDFLSGTDAGGNPLHITNTAAVNLKRGAAFNPTTGAFINHASGGTSANIGDFDLPQGGVTEINGSSFSVDSMVVSGRSVEGFEFQIPGALVITSVPSPIPELGTWAMLFLGFAGLGCLARRRMREA